MSGVLAVAAGEEDPIGVLRDLYSAPNLPPLLVDQNMDPAIHKHYVVLSDSASHQYASATLRLPVDTETDG